MLKKRRIIFVAVFVCALLIVRPTSLATASTRAASARLATRGVAVAILNDFLNIVGWGFPIEEADSRVYVDGNRETECFKKGVVIVYQDENSGAGLTHDNVFSCSSCADVSMCGDCVIQNRLEVYSGRDHTWEDVTVGNMPVGLLETAFSTTSSDRQFSFYFYADGYYFIAHGLFLCEDTVATGRERVNQWGLSLIEAAQQNGVYYTAPGSSQSPTDSPNNQPEDDPNNDPVLIPTYASEDYCSNISCASAVCSDGWSYYGNPSCNSEQGECEYETREYCDFGCSADTGYCLTQDQAFDAYCEDQVSSCGSYCEGTISYSAYTCNRNSGDCVYEQTTCGEGCNISTGQCFVPEPEIDLLDILLVGGGIAVVGGGALGGGFLAFRALRGRLAKQAVKSIAVKPKISKPTSLPVKQTLVRTLTQDPDIQRAEKVRSRIDDLLEKINKMERAHVQHGVEHTVEMANSYNQTDIRLARDEFIFKTAQKVADEGANIVGLVPGAGRVFKYGYTATTSFIESSIEHGAQEGAIKAIGKTAESIIGDKIGDRIKLRGVEDLASSTINKNVKKIIKENGLKRFRNNYVKDKGIGKLLGKIKK